MKNFHVEIDTNEGIFQYVTKRASIFGEHVTAKELGEFMVALKKEIRKVSLKGRNMITTSWSSDGTYQTNSLTRFIIETYVDKHGFYTVDFRPYNGSDFSDVHYAKFETHNKAVDYVVKRIQNEVESTLDDIPEEVSHYRTKIRKESTN